MLKRQISEDHWSLVGVAAPHERQLLTIVNGRGPGYPGVLMDTEQVAMVWMAALAISTTTVFVPAGPYRETSGISGARSWGEMRGKTGNFQAQAAVEHTNDPRVPGTTVGIGNTATANGVIDPAAVTALSLDGSRWIRPGWLVSLSSGNTLAGGHLAGVVEFRFC